MAGVPDAFLDPVFGEIMVDPVITCDGHTFERAAVERWFQTRPSNPLTGADLTSTTLTPNITLRKAIADWRETHYKILPRSSISIGRQCGRGSFKVVYQGTLRLAGSRAATTVAVLKVPRGTLATEVEVLLKLSQHPRLVQYFGMCEDGPDTLLVTEFAPMVDFFNPSPPP